MKIAPPRGRTSIAADQPEKLKQWMAALGRTLPKDYQTFLLRYDGGAPYPNIFDDPTPAELREVADTQVFCDRLYPLDDARAEAEGANYGDAVPSGFVPFAEDPGGIVLLLSLREGDFGAVMVWRATIATWGSDDNNHSHLFRQSDSFTAFLTSLYDTDDKIGYAQWTTPWRLENARDLDLT